MMTPLSWLGVVCLLMILVSSSSAKKCQQDEEYSCPDTSTCCPLPPGQGIGCCPYRGATCCADQMHCCPHGMTCDVKAARCEGPGYQLLLSSLSLPPTKLAVQKFCPNHS